MNKESENLKLFFIVDTLITLCLLLTVDSNFWQVLQWYQKTPGSATLLSDDENRFIFYDKKIIKHSGFFSAVAEARKINFIS